MLQVGATGIEEEEKEDIHTKTRYVVVRCTLIFTIVDGIREEK
jgi:hypothetical protein